MFLRGFGPSPNENRLRFQRWLEATRTEAIVFLDIPPGSRFYFSVVENLAQYRDLLLSQSDFEPFVKRYFTEYGCTVSLWRRSAKIAEGNKNQDRRQWRAAISSGRHHP